jgi:hypothetical protein
MNKNPRLQRAHIAANGVTIEPLPLALEAGTLVIVATVEALSEAFDKDLALCEGCEGLFPFEGMHSWGEDGGYGCDACTEALAEEVPHAATDAAG